MICLHIETGSSHCFRLLEGKHADDSVMFLTGTSWWCGTVPWYLCRQCLAGRAKNLPDKSYDYASFYDELWVSVSYMRMYSTWICICICMYIYMYRIVNIYICVCVLHVFGCKSTDIQDWIECLPIFQQLLNNFHDPSSIRMGVTMPQFSTSPFFGWVLGNKIECVLSMITKRPYPLVI